MSTQIPDSQALADFTQSRSSQAFASLVQNYIDLVYSTAQRITRDPHIAEDAAQAVFIVLARRASTINPKHLAGWMVNTARLAARDALRSRNRQKIHEAKAAQMRSEIKSPDEPSVDEITPLLDDVLARLNESDRAAVAMRFLQGRSFVSVGEQFGISEEAARKRVERAVEKLRVHLLKQGFTPTVGGLTIVLAAHQAIPAPAILATHAAASVFTPSVGAATSIAKGVGVTMTLMKAQAAAAAVLITVIVGGTGVAGIMAANHRLAGAQPTTAPATQTAAEAVASMPTDELIRPNDRLRVRIEDLIGQGVETTFRRRVDPAGQIRLPYIDIIQVKGLEPPQVETTINTALRQANLIQNAIVIVEFDQRGSQVSIPSTPIQIGDYVAMHIFDADNPGKEESLVQRVWGKGYVSPPRLQGVKVDGLTEYDAEKALVAAYASANLHQYQIVSLERISEREATQPPVVRPERAERVMETIQPNDRLLIQIKDLDGSGVFRARVDPSGRISLPLVGLVHVGGEMPPQAEAQISNAFRTANLINHANVVVAFNERGSQISIASGRIAIGDHIRLGIADLIGRGKTLTMLRRVNASGMISPPLVGEVNVVGLTEFEAEKAVVQAYRDSNFLQNAQISVERISAAEAAAGH